MIHSEEKEGFPGEKKEGPKPLFSVEAVWFYVIGSFRIHHRVGAAVAGIDLHGRYLDHT